MWFQLGQDIKMVPFDERGREVVILASIFEKSTVWWENTWSSWWGVPHGGDISPLKISARSLLGRLLQASSPLGCMACLGKLTVFQITTENRPPHFWEIKTFNIPFNSQPLLILPSCSSVGGHLDKWSRQTSHERGTFQALNHYTLRSWDCCRFEYSYIVWAYLLVLAPLPVLTQSLVDTCGPEFSP